jgi:hypothetical protein
MSSSSYHKHLVTVRLDPAIHGLARDAEDVDARCKAGHDDEFGATP